MTDKSIENYKDLLVSIFNTDNPNPNKKHIICVYDTKEKDKLIAIFNSSETCAIFFKTTVNSIDSSISRTNLRLKRYRLERLKLE